MPKVVLYRASHDQNGNMIVPAGKVVVLSDGEVLGVEPDPSARALARTANFNSLRDGVVLRDGVGTASLMYTFSSRDNLRIATAAAGVIGEWGTMAAAYSDVVPSTRRSNQDADAIHESSAGNLALVGAIPERSRMDLLLEDELE